MSFDDEAPTQLTNVIPELNAREIVGTFYVVTGNGLWEASADQWAEAAKSPYVALANHTFTHEGVNNPEELELELQKSNEVLYRIYADRPQPFLLSFGMPGGVPWNVTSDEQATALKRHNLVERPPFRGSPSNYTSQDEVLASADDALAHGDVGYNDMHGVGGDWLSTPIEWFTALLDKLASARDRLWVPDVVSYSKYLAERQTAEVKVIKASANEIRIALTAQVDPVLYNYPLTLVTRVPVGWTNVTVRQGLTRSEVQVKGGTVMYDAVPGAGDVLVAPG